MTAELAALRRVLARTTWRFRLQRGLEFATWALAVLSGVGVALVSFTGEPLKLLHGAIALFLFCALGLVWPSSDMRAAHAVDRAAGLVGRCAAALAFLRVGEAERTPFMIAALRDAARHAERASAAQAAPWRRPRATIPALLLTVLVSILPARTAHEARPAQPAALPPVHERLLPQDDLVAFRALLERMPARTSDSGLQQLLAQYQKLLSALEEGSLDRAAATAQLLELEVALSVATTGMDERSFMRTLAEELSTVRPSLGESLQHGIRRAVEALAKLGQELAKQELDERERTRLAAALARARERNAQQQERAHDEEPHLLAQKGQTSSGDAPEPRLLEQKRRELETLRRERKSVASEQRRQLERLTRELARAEQALHAGQAGDAQAGDALERASEALSDHASLKELEQQLAQLREQLQQQQAQQQAQQTRQESAQQRGAQQERPDGDGDSWAERRERFRLRAQGSEPEDAGAKLALAKNAQAGAQDGGNANDEASQQSQARTLALGGGAGEGAQIELPGPRARLEQSSATASGEHDERRIAESERKQRAYDDEQLANGRGEGPSRSQVIAAAARGGFARASYRKVFADYQAHAEQLLERDDVPPGYRFYVRRYFQLVRPRTAEETP